jgi:precorrin-3B synthase
MPLGHIGARQQADGRFAMGAVPPLARLDSSMLRGLADLADDVSDGEIRLTPWQSVLLPNIAEGVLIDAAAQLEELGLIIRPDRTLAATITCAGSVGCKSGLADTKADALALADEIDGAGATVFGIHLTGCSKSCASPRPAPVTLLGMSPGHYDVFLRTDTEKAGFGKRIGADLTIEQAGHLLAQRRAAKSS